MSTHEYLYAFGFFRLIVAQNLHPLNEQLHVSGILNVARCPFDARLASARYLTRVCVRVCCSIQWTAVAVVAVAAAVVAAAAAGKP